MLKFYQKKKTSQVPVGEQQKRKFILSRQGQKIAEKLKQDYY